MSEDENKIESTNLEEQNNHNSITLDDVLSDDSTLDINLEKKENYDLNSNENLDVTPNSDDLSSFDNKNEPNYETSDNSINNENLDNNVSESENTNIDNNEQENTQTESTNYETGSVISNDVNEVSETTSVDNTTNEENVTAPNSENTNNETPKVEVTSLPEKKKNTGLLVLIIIVMVLALLAVAYKFLLLTPKNIVLKSINNEYKTISRLFDEASSNKFYSLMNDNSFKMNTDFTIAADINEDLLDDDTKTIIAELNKLRFSYSLGINNASKELDAGFKLSNGTDSLDASVYGRDGKIYIDLKELFNKYIYSEVEEYDTIFENDNVDLAQLEYVAEKTKNEFMRNFDKTKFEKTKETISIDGNDVKVNKISYKLTDKELDNIIKNMLVNLKEDEKFVSSLSKLTNKTNDEVLKEMQDEIDGIENNSFYQENTFTFNVYTKGILETAVKYEIVYNYQSGESNFSDNSVSYTIGKDSKIIESKSGSEEPLTITIKDSQIVVNSVDFNLTLDIQKNSDTDITVNYSFNGLTNKISATGIVKIVEQEIEKDKKYNVKVNISADVKNNNDNIGTFGIDTDSNIIFGEELTSIDTTNSVDYNNLTEEDINTISTNLLENRFIGKLMESFNSALQTSIQSDSSMGLEDDLY